MQKGGSFLRVFRCFFSFLGNEWQTNRKITILNTLPSVAIEVQHEI